MPISSLHVDHSPPSLRRTKVVSTIVDRVIQHMQDGHLNPGDRLPSERQFMQMLGVGRSSVREALQVLTTLRLVESHHGQGTFVSSSLLLVTINNDGLSEHLKRHVRLHMVEVRRMVEVPGARFAADRATPESIVRLRQALQRYSEDPVVRPLGSTFPAPHAALHILIAQLTENPFLESVVEDLFRSLPASFRRPEGVVPGEELLFNARVEAIEQHTLIVDAIARHDGEAAARLMDQHMDSEVDHIRRMFPKDGSPSTG